VSAEIPGEWPLTHEEVEAWCRVVEWREAVTAPDNPHSYTLRRNTDPIMFWRVVLHIREHGYQYRWGRREYTQLRADSHDMWTMGAPAECTILINRKAVEQTKKDEAEGKAGCGPVDPEDARRKRGGA
jgi:hypothetical protein